MMIQINEVTVCVHTISPPFVRVSTTPINDYLCPDIKLCGNVIFGIFINKLMIDKAIGVEELEKMYIEQMEKDGA